MAEFQEIMKIRERMCKEADEYCTDCPLKAFSECKTPRIDELEEYEKAIVQWAAEHPEPQYPTWREWHNKLFPNAEHICSLCGFAKCEMENRDCGKCADKPIPADIAEKLGIKPAEANE